MIGPTISYEEYWFMVAEGRTAYEAVEQFSLRTPEDAEEWLSEWETAAVRRRFPGGDVARRAELVRWRKMLGHHARGLALLIAALPAREVES